MSSMTPTPEPTPPLSPPCINRIEWVDIARLWAMIFILIQHSPLSSEVKGITEFFHQSSWVQFFFLLSGYFLAKKPIRQLLDVSRAKFLLYPYLFWAILYLILNGIPEMIAAWKDGGLSGWTHFFITQGLGIGGKPLNLPLWFLRDLALFSLLSPLFLRLPWSVRVGFTAFIICFPSHYLIPQACEFTLPWFQGLRLFCLGMLLAPFSLSSIRHYAFSRPLAWAWVIVSLIISALQIIFPGHYGEVSTLLGISALIGLSILTTEYFPQLGHKMAQLAPCIFLIYASHITLITLIFKVAIPLGYKSLPDPLWFFVLIPLLIIFPWYGYKALSRYTPSWLPIIAATPHPKNK